MANKADLGAPFGLGVAAGIIVLIVSILFGLVGLVFGAAASLLFKGALGLSVGLLIWGIIDGILILLGSFMIHGGGSNAKTGSILVLIFSILGFFTPGRGLIVGPILGIVGGALGISKTK